MASLTERYKLQKLQSGDQLSTNGYAFTDSNVESIDRILYQGAEGHQHTGEAGTSNDPTLGPSLNLGTTGGGIPGGLRVYYKYTLVNATGFESAASPESFVDMPAPVTDPAVPTLSSATTGGILAPGQYYYVLSAYTGSTTFETRATAPSQITVPTGTSTNAVTITFPTQPNGASGFNVYRRAPGQSKYFFLAAVDMLTATPPDTFLDDGDPAEDCDRGVPTTNNTNSSNYVTVVFPGATPVVPVGYTWKIYRTFVAGAYSNSVLHHVVEETTEGSGVAAVQYIDLGNATTAGAPPAASQVVGNPAKILLTGGAEVQGLLPAAMIDGGAGGGDQSLRLRVPEGLGDGSTWNGPEYYLEASGEFEWAYASHNVDLNVAGDLDIRVKFQNGSSLNGTVEIASRYTSTSTRVWGINSVIGRNIQFRLARVSTGWAVDHTSSVAFPIADGQDAWLRVTHDIDDGAGNCVTTYYSSTDGETWDAFGTPQTSATTGANATPTARLNIGGGNWASGDVFTGRFYEFELRDGIDGTVLSHWDLTALDVGTGVTFTDDQAHSWNALDQNVLGPVGGDPVALTDGAVTWVCDHPSAEILGIRAYCDYGHAPTGQPVIMHVERYSGASPTWDPIYVDPLDGPTVGVGDQFGVLTVPDVVDLVEGDALAVCFVQDGGGATPNHGDVIVNIHIRGAA